MKRLADVLARVAPRGAVEAARVLVAWRRVAEETGVSAEAEYRAGRLEVLAAGSAQAQELSLRAESLRQAVNRVLGGELVREIRVRAFRR